MTVSTDDPVAGTVQIEKTEWVRGRRLDAADRVVEELPVALVYNGISHAVMMATPVDLEDFALGFSLSEGILHSTRELVGVDVAAGEAGVEVNLQVLNSCFERLKRRRRTLTGRTGCGLCGAESLEQAMLVPPPVTASLTLSHRAVDRAAGGFAQYQPLQRQTGACHGAVWCRGDGEVVLVREDVGRHNALDKLLGALAARPREPGFVLVTSRASYEMVSKVARLNIPVLACVSAPTSLAIQIARRCGVTLLGFLQGGRHVVYSGELV